MRPSPIPGWCRTCSRARRLRTCVCDHWWGCPRRVVAGSAPARPGCPMERSDGRDTIRSGTDRLSPPSVPGSWDSRTKKTFFSPTGNRQQLRNLYIIEISSDDVNVAREALQVVERFLCAQVAGHQDVMDPSRHQQLLEFTRNRLRPKIQRKKQKQFRPFRVFSVFTWMEYANHRARARAEIRRKWAQVRLPLGAEFVVFTMIFD